MSRKTSNIRRGAALLVLAVGLLASTGPGVSAAGLGLPEELSGAADSQALEVTVQVPSADEFLAAVKAALGSNFQSVTLPQLGIDGIKITQKVSLNSANVLRSVDNTIADFASGFAAPLQGSLLNNSVSSRCESSACNTGDSVAKQTIELPLGLGHISVNGAESLTKSALDSRNTTALAEINLSLAELIGPGKPLAAVGDALRTLTETVNDAVLPPVNDAIEQAEAAVRGLLPDNLEHDILDRIVTHIGPVKDLPALDTVDLVDLMVLGAKADVLPATRLGKEGMLARSSSKVADLNILGDWTTVDAVNLSTEAFANGIRGGAQAIAHSQVLGAEFGGALGIDISKGDLADFLNPEYIKKVLLETGVPAGLEGALDEVIAAYDLLQNIAGITVETFGTTEKAARDGLSASATAASLKLTVAPALPKIDALLGNLPSADAIIPRLGPDDFVSTGIVVSVELPKASSAVAMGSTVLDFRPPPPTTGVATPIFAGMLLLGAALMVRRFALTK